jgi:hypothetical protein
LLQARIPASNLYRAVNRTLPAEIRILDAKVVPDTTLDTRQGKDLREWSAVDRAGNAQICPAFACVYAYLARADDGS